MNISPVYPSLGAIPLARNVLVADACPPICGLIACQLGALGYQVHTAYNAEDAQSIISELGPANLSLLMIDMNVPGMHGSEIADAYCTGNPDAKVMLMSGRACPLNLADHVQFLSKPFQIEEVGNRVSKLLNDPALVPEEIAA